MNLIQIIVMVIAAIGAIVGWSNSKKGASWGQPVSTICAIVAIIAALYGIIHQLTGGEQKDIIAKEHRFQEIQGIKLGQELVKTMSGKKAIVLLGEGDPTKNFSYQGLKKALGNDITIVQELILTNPKPSTQDGGIGVPMEEWYKAEYLDKELAKVSGSYDLVITLCGLPIDTRCGATITAPARLGKVKLAFLNSSVYEFGKLFQSKVIVGAVTYNPDAVYDDKPVPKKFDEAFNKRYVYICPENLKEVFSKYKNLFKTR